MTTLADCLDRWAESATARKPVAAAIAALARGAVGVGEMLAAGPQEIDGDDMGVAAGRRAEAIMVAALRSAPVAWVATESGEAPIAIEPGAPLAVAVEPLDAAANAAIGAPTGTIFSVLPVPSMAGTDGALAFLQQGERQLAAGFVLHGVFTALVLTLRDGTRMFVLDRATGVFRLAQPVLSVPDGRRAYAINAANYRYWSEAVRSYVDDCIAGGDGPRGADFHMRWLGCVTAETMRVLQRGGIYLYPSDSRPDHRRGRLRLVFHAHPLALLIEQAGGAATDGVEPILQMAARRLTDRSPLVFGASEKVERVVGYETMRLPLGERSPLFGRRGLYRV
jgi:fructose-1,6-bisphosphatase I